MTASPLEIIAEDEFQAVVSQLAAELRGGADISLESTAERLGLPLDFLLCCAAQWLANTTGAAVVVLPQEMRTRH